MSRNRYLSHRSHKAGISGTDIGKVVKGKIELEFEDPLQERKDLPQWGYRRAGNKKAR